MGQFLLADVPASSATFIAVLAGAAWACSLHHSSFSVWQSLLLSVTRGKRSEMGSCCARAQAAMQFLSAAVLNFSLPVYHITLLVMREASCLSMEPQEAIVFAERFAVYARRLSARHARRSAVSATLIRSVRFRTTCACFPRDAAARVETKPADITSSCCYLYADTCSLSSSSQQVLKRSQGGSSRSLDYNPTTQELFTRVISSQVDLFGLLVCVCDRVQRSAIRG